MGRGAGGLFACAGGTEGSGGSFLAVVGAPVVGDGLRIALFVAAATCPSKSTSIVLSVRIRAN